MNNLHGAARQWTTFIPIFPCLPNAKKPATEHGFKDATTDLAQIDKWWTENPNYNLGACPDDAGCYVVDFDGAEGLRTYKAWEQMGRFSSKHWHVRTPSGGIHVWYQGKRPSNVKTLAPGVDTRGVGGYVLLPPSMVNGNEYVFFTP